METADLSVQFGDIFIGSVLFKKIDQYLNVTAKILHGRYQYSLAMILDATATSAGPIKNCVKSQIAATLYILREWHEDINFVERRW